MISTVITKADMVAVTGFSRDKLKGLFRELPGFQEPAEQARVARHYTRHDLLVIAVCCQLDERFGMKRQVIGELLDGIQQALQGPRTVATNAHLVIDVPTHTVRYAEKVGPISEGLILSLTDIFKRVDTHIEHGITGTLDLPPVALPTSVSKTSRLPKKSAVVQMASKKKATGTRR